MAACSLTTSLDGLANGDLTGAPDAGPAADGGGVDGDASSGTGDEGGAATDGGALDYRALVLSDAPLAYYRLGDPGLTAKDELGAHDGVYKGTPAHAAGAIAGETNGAAVFDGTSSYVDVGDVLPFLDDAPFTIEAWASPVSGATDPACIAAKSISPGGATGSLSDGYTLYLDSGSNAVSLARYRSNDDDTITGPGIAVDSFTYVVATYDGATLSIWLDGIQVKSGPSTRALATVANPLVIGAGRGGVYCFFRGALDEVAFYDKALPLARIRAHHDKGIGK